MSEGRIEEAKLNVKKIAEINGNDPIDDDLLDYYLGQQSAKSGGGGGGGGKKTSLKEILKFPRFCRIFSLTSVIWLLLTFSFMGGNGFAAMSTDNPYMMLSINAVIDCIACLAAEYAAGNRYLGRKFGTIGSCCGAGIFYILSGLLPSSYEVSTLVMLMIARLAATLALNIQFLYAAEVFPTEIRGTAFALKLSIGAIGALISPQILALQRYHKAIPLLSFGGAILVSAALKFLLPESLGESLPQTLLDAETFGLPFDQKLAIRTKHNIKLSAPYENHENECYATTENL